MKCVMEDKKACCIDCAKLIECFGPDIELDDPRIINLIDCLDYQNIEDNLND